MTPLRVHPEARDERLRIIRRMRGADARQRFDGCLRALFLRVREAPGQFPEHGLIAVDAVERPLFYMVRRAVLPAAFPFTPKTHATLPASSAH